MAGAKWNELLRLLRQVDARVHAAGTTDGQLLERFVQLHDESAFELLLFRHGGMVLNVCRRILIRDQDAEDAFQATFLTLVRKAHSIRRRDAIAGWLYRVAYRAAQEARARSAHIAQHEKTADRMVEPAAAGDPGWAELRPILDEEMGRLPERFRLPLILCYLEGKTNEQAALELGCPTGTVFSRLAKGRELLRHRLVRRGLTLSVGGLGASLAEHATIAAPTPALVNAALQVGQLVMTGQAAAVSAQVQTITKGVLKAMFLQKLKHAAVAALILLALGLGGGGLVYQSLPAAQPEQVAVDPPAAPQAKAKAPQQPEAPKSIKLTKPKKGGVEHFSNQPGYLVSCEAVEIAPNVAGLLKTLTVDIGDRVAKGQILAEIDAPELGKDVEQAKIAVALAKAKFVQQEASIRTAAAEVRSAVSVIAQREAMLVAAKADEARWEAEFARAKKLADKGVFDQHTADEVRKQLDSSRSQAEAAKAALETAKADKEIRQTKVGLAEAALEIERLQVDSARVALERAEILLDGTHIKAPFNGLVTRRKGNIGDMLNKNSPPILRLIRTDCMRTVIEVPETEAIHIRMGQSVKMTVAVEGKTLEAKVSRFSSSLDKVTRSMRVEVDLPNTDWRLLEGMYMNSHINLGFLRPDALSIPVSCVVNNALIGDPRNGVLVVKAGKAVFTVIDGRQFGDTVEVYSGLNAGDHIVADPWNVKDGDPVPTK